jgi:hypothetical protein
MVSLRAVIQTLCGTHTCDRLYQSRGGLQGGGIASLHNPVRASQFSGPGLSSSGTVLTQPDSSQAATHKPIIAFTVAPDRRRRILN